MECSITDPRCLLEWLMFGVALVIIIHWGLYLCDKIKGYKQHKRFEDKMKNLETLHQLEVMQIYQKFDRDVHELTERARKFKVEEIGKIMPRIRNDSGRDR